MQESPVIFFAQKLAANTKQIRDKAIRRLKKWLIARSSSTATQLTEDDIMKLWKGLFYCMWMSDKPVVQEELAKTISEFISCFVTTSSSLLFIKGFFVTMSREWSNLDYLRVDKFMMLVRVFLNHSFEFTRKLKWEDVTTNQLIGILEDSVINPKLEDTPVGLQMHVADIYVEELAKVASGELSGKQLTTFFLPYCRLLAENKNSSLRWTVIHHVFEFTMRLCDSDSESEGESENEDETRKETNMPKMGSGSPEDAKDEEAEDMEEDESDTDEDDNLSKIYGEYKGEDKFLREVRRHERETMKLPFPNFDYQDMGDTLLELVGKSTVNIKQKLRNQTYRLVKRFHEMASGIFPLDGVNPSIGRRLRTSDYDAAAMRLIRLDEEIAKEKRLWHEEVWKDRKKKLVAKSDEPGEEDLQNEDKEGSVNEDEEGSVNEDDEGSVNEDDEGLLCEDEEGSSNAVKENSHEPIVRKHKMLCRKEHAPDDFLQLEQHRRNKRTPLHKLKAATIHESKKRRRSKDVRETPSAMGEQAAKKAKIVAPHTNLMVNSQEISNDKLAQRLILKKDVPMVTNNTGLDSKARKSAVKRNKRKARAMRQKEAKLARKAKGMEKVMDDNGQENGGLTKKPKLEHADRPAALSSASDPLLSIQDVDLDMLSNSQKVINAILAESADDIEAQEQIQANVQVSNKLKERNMEKQFMVTDLANVEDGVIAQERLEKSVLGKMEFSALTDSPGTVDLPVQTLLETPPPQKIQGTGKLFRQSKQAALPDDKNSDPVEKVATLSKATTEVAVSTPEAIVKQKDEDGSVLEGKINPVSTLKEPVCKKSADEHADSPSPKRKVELVTLWTPLKKTSPTSNGTPGPRRSARTARNMALAQQPTPTGRRSMVNKNRYYDEVPVMDLDQSGEPVSSIRDAPANAKSASTRKSTPMVQFEDFIKTPPAFFRIAVKKVTPQKTPNSTKEDVPMEESIEGVTRSAKKVNFSLAKNSSQGLRHYAMSLRSRPGIPFNADKVPAQGVLKSSPPAQLNTTSKKRRSVK